MIFCEHGGPPRLCVRCLMRRAGRLGGAARSEAQTAARRRNIARAIAARRVTIDLSADIEASGRLETLVRDATDPDGARRAWAIVGIAAGAPVEHVASRLAVSRQAVHSWVRSWRAGGAEALRSRRRGRPRKAMPSP